MKRLAIIYLFAALLTPAAERPQELLELAAKQGVKPHDSSNPSVFLYAFTRNGEKHDTLVLTAGSTLQIDVPVTNSAKCISLKAAMPFNLGDGAALKISTGDANHRQQVLKLSLDPVHVRGDRSWIPIRFAIPDGANPLQLTFEAEPGARNDSTADWIGLAAGSDRGCLLAETSQSSK